MLEGVRQYMMDKVVLKSEMFAKCTDTLPPRIRKRVEREKEEARLCVAKQTLNARQAWPAPEGTPVHPPKIRSIPGRPKKKIRRSANEVEETRAQRNEVGEEVTRRGNLIHCSKCGGEGHNARSCKAPPVAEVVVSSTHNARTCPLNRGNGVQDVIVNVADRRTIERELRIATSGVGIYVNERTGNQYVRLNGVAGRPVRGPHPTFVDLHGSQPPPSQP
ncbi:unnamed protein product [Linum trigynum]|uniref:CCHC-type domain-containing protein n=1 Tax=Linum trigynum TaxID=586398 RepID=A0AAV2DYB4_9ROSI